MWRRIRISVLGLARELLQSCCNTIERERGDAIDYEAPLPQRAKKLIDRVMFGFAGHPEQADIEVHLTALVGSLNGAVRVFYNSPISPACAMVVMPIGPARRGDMRCCWRGPSMP